MTLGYFAFQPASIWWRGSVKGETCLEQRPFSRDPLLARLAAPSSPGVLFHFSYFSEHISRTVNLLAAYQPDPFFPDAKELQDSGGTARKML